MKWIVSILIGLILISCADDIQTKSVYFDINFPSSFTISSFSEVNSVLKCPEIEINKSVYGSDYISFANEIIKDGSSQIEFTINDYEDGDLCTIEFELYNIGTLSYSSSSSFYIDGDNDQLIYISLPIILTSN